MAVKGPEFRKDFNPECLPQIRKNAKLTGSNLLSKMYQRGIGRAALRAMRFVWKYPSKSGPRCVPGSDSSRKQLIKPDGPVPRVSSTLRLTFDSHSILNDCHRHAYRAQLRQAHYKNRSCRRGVRPQTAWRRTCSTSIQRSITTHQTVARTVSYRSTSCSSSTSSPGVKDTGAM